MYQILVPLIGVLGGLAFIFFVSLFLAPYQHRREASNHIATLQAEIIKVRRELGKAKSQLFATPDELVAQTLRGISFRIADLAREDFIIRSRTFEDCHVYGPACITPLGTTVITGSNFDGTPDVIFIGIDQPKLLGAIGVEDCVFRRCTFKRIGIIAPSEYIEKIKKEL